MCLSSRPTRIPIPEALSVCLTPDTASTQNAMHQQPLFCWASRNGYARDWFLAKVAASNGLCQGGEGAAARRMIAPWPPLSSMVGAAFNGRTVEWWWEGCCCRCGRDLGQTSTRRDHPRSPNLFLPPAPLFAVALGTGSKHDLRCERPYCCSLIVFPKRNNGTAHRSAGVTASFRTLRSPKLSSLRPSPPRASVRAPCVHVSPYSSPPALLHQRRLPRSLRLPAETSVAAGGLGEECTLGRKLHF